MALTKVSGGILDPGIDVAGIVTATGFDGPFTGGSSKNITAGVVTATSLDLNGNGDISGNLVIGGNLTANGDFTTLNTTLREVELLKVDAQNDNVAAGIITQRGTGNILDLYDTSSAVFSVRDGGNIIMGASAGSITPHAPLHIRTATTGAITTLLKLHGPFTSNTGSEGTAIDFGTASDTSTGARIIGSREAAGAKGALRFCTGRENDSGFNDGHMVIDETGSVGIGSTIPSEKLDVVGVTSFTGDVFFKGGLTTPAPRDMFWDYSARELRFKDNAVIYLGSNKDAFLSHDGSSTRLQDNYGHFFIGGNLIQIKSGNLSKEFIRMNSTDNTVKLYFNTTEQLSTTGYGVTVLGTTETQKLNVTGISTFNDEVNVVQGKKINFGNTNGTTGHIYYDGSTTRLQTNQGLNIGAPVVSLKGAGLVGVMGEFIQNGVVKLFENSNLKFQTTGIGVSVIGIASATSFTAIESGVSGQYKANEIEFDRNSYNYISCTDDSGQLVIRM